MPTEQEIEKLYEGLPQNTKDLLTSPNTAKTVTLIAKKYSFDSLKTEMLLNEVGLVLLGVEEAETFSEDLMDVFGIEKEKAQSLTEELNHEIFSLAKQTTPQNQVFEAKNNTNTDSMREILRKNSKTVNIKNMISNFE